jgi:hypothetical protein
MPFDRTPWQSYYKSTPIIHMIVTHRHGRRFGKGN